MKCFFECCQVGVLTVIPLDRKGDLSEEPVIPLEKLNYLEESILSLGDNLYAGTVPRYTVLKRQGYLVLILEKDLVFYKVDDDKKLVTVYAVVDQRQDYLSIIRGL